VGAQQGAHLVTRSDQRTRIGGEADEGDDEYRKQGPEIACPGEHDQARYAAAGEYHAETEDQSADQRPRKALRGAEEPGLGDMQHSRRQQRLHREQRGGEAHEPRREGAAVAASHDVEHGRTGTEAASLSGDPEEEAQQRGADHGRTGFAEPVDQGNEVHASLRDGAPSAPWPSLYARGMRTGNPALCVNS
jgi:hypothetical protein